MGYREIRKAEYFLRLLFPARCICCDMVLPINASEEVCSECGKSLKTLNKFGYVNLPGSIITKVYSVFEYEGGIRKAIHRLKFGESPRNAFVLVDLSYPILKSFLDRQFPCMPCSN